jgi:general secretion pathway protein G
MRGTKKAGFTLIELLIVVAIIGIIATIIIPMFLDAIQKSKQKRSMVEVKIVGTCWMAWLTDEISAGAAGSTTRTYNLNGLDIIPQEDLLRTLFRSQTFFYCSEVPAVDGWGNAYEYYYNFENPTAGKTFAIRSTGRDGVFSGTTYRITPYVQTHYDEDIVWADGLFVYYPQGIAVIKAIEEQTGTP